MSRFSGSSHLSDSPSSPQVIPDRTASCVNDVLSFTSWNDELSAFETPEDFLTTGGDVPTTTRVSDPVPIVRSGSRPASTSSFDLPDLQTPTNSCMESPTIHKAVLNGHQPDSMADWSVPSYPSPIHSAHIIGHSPHRSTPPNGHQYSRSRETDNSHWSCLAESGCDDPNSLTASWVNLPPVSESRKTSKLRTRELQSKVIVEREYVQTSSPRGQSTVPEARARTNSTVLSDSTVPEPRARTNSTQLSDSIVPESRPRTNSTPLAYSTFPENRSRTSGHVPESRRRSASGTGGSNGGTPALLSCEEERVLALNSWTDVNDEHLLSPRESSPARNEKPREQNVWSEMFGLDKPQSKTNNDKGRLKDKLLSKFSITMKRESSPTKTATDQRRASGSTGTRTSDNGTVARTSMDRGSHHMYVTSPHGFYPSLAGYNTDSSETFRTKLQSAWNNVKYGWTVKAPTHFSEEKPLFLLGKCYHSKIDESTSHETPISSLDKFRQDFGSRIWFTYRREFNPLSGSNLTTDCGWGCMLRSGQMMLAQAFVLHYLGRDWNWYCAQSSGVERYHRQIVRWFLDTPSSQSPFSLHNLVKLGTSGMGKKAGDWYGPASIAQILSRAMDDAPELNPSLEDLCLYVAHDCTLYIQDIVELCTKRYRSNSCDTPEPTDCGDTWRSVVILIPVRLGGEVLNSIYVPCLKTMLSQDCCLGVMGGKPKHSLYFTGWQDDKLIYLDPHYCQDAVVTNAKDSLKDFPLHTYHCMSPRKISFSRMDPSCTIGFYCRTRNDFEQFIAFTREAGSPPLQKSQYPMFIFVDGKSTDVTDKHSLICDDVMAFHSSSFIQSTLVEDPHDPPPARTKSMSRTSEEFVFL